MGGSGYVASGDDDTVSISNDPSTTFTGNTVTTQGDTAPVTGAVSSGLSGKPVVGKPSSVTKLPDGGTDATTTSYYAKPTSYGYPNVYIKTN